ncbi:MAG: STAS domain-containing protein [Betaproteobacteria bacterium]|nr:STAS domain-containing protein [Betaproteobacteria bacterium]MCL2885738.1 STAS domain-containing protein [Betaproteobacteria bacterium]
MVFSFFKKPTEKMPERRVAKPRGQAVESVPPQMPEEVPAALRESLPEIEFTNSKPFAASAPVAKPQAPAMEDFDDLDFTDSSVMGINIDDAGDPVQGDIEHVVVLFANGQEVAARSLLETLIRAHSGAEGRRFWLLLFDLLQCLGDRAAFDKLALEFAETYETSPPPWRQAEPVTERKSNSRRLQLQGVLTAEGAGPVAELADLVARGLQVIVECGKLAGCDDEVAGQLAAVLRDARKSGVAVTLKEVEGFLSRLNERLPAGERGREAAWALLLELLQRHGQQDLFEERAIDYAVTFELSPPSWESMPASEVEPEAADPEREDDAHYLVGDLNNCRFEELVEVIEGREHPVIDFSDVRRMDFFSAGQLVNRVAPYKAEGREILIRSPNHLVAELMVVVGLNKQARIIVPKS